MCILVRLLVTCVATGVADWLISQWRGNQEASPAGIPSLRVPLFSGGRLVACHACATAHAHMAVSGTRGSGEQLDRGRVPPAPHPPAKGGCWREGGLGQIVDWLDGEDYTYHGPSRQALGSRAESGAVRPTTLVSHRGVGFAPPANRHY